MMISIFLKIKLVVNITKFYTLRLVRNLVVFLYFSAFLTRLPLTG